MAAFSLEAGEPAVERVSEAGLRSALRRTLDAVSRMIELTVEGRPAGRSAEPGVLHLPSGVRPVAIARCRSDGGTAVTASSSATGRPRPASARTVAIERPGCTAGLGWADQLRPEPLGGHVEILAR